MSTLYESESKTTHQYVCLLIRSYFTSELSHQSIQSGEDFNALIHF